MPVLHVVVPVFNERETLEPCLRRVLEARLPTDWRATLYLVDDHSEAAAFADAEVLVGRLSAAGHAIDLFRHDANRGKGAALQTGFDAVLERGAPSELVTIQDADLEYDPADFARLMEPVLSGRAQAVIGTRWGGHAALDGLTRRVHAWANRTLTRLSNLMTGLRVSDMECCYKLMTVDLLRRLRPMLTEARFGIEPQLVAGLARLGAQVEEVPVTYAARALRAGNKIGWTDGVRAVYVIGRERLRGAGEARP